MSVREIERRARWSAAHLRDVRATMTQLAKRLRAMERIELSDTVLRRRDQLVDDVVARIVLAGEFKAGKTALVNALVGSTVVPDDPLVPTAVPVEVVHRARAGQWVIGPDGSVEPIGVERLRRLAVTTDPEELAGVARLVAGVPSPFLEPGIVLVDAPNVSSGLASPGAAAVLGLIQGADALLVVRDAAREMDAAAVELIEAARALADPVVVTALTKIDLHAHWGEVAEVDRARLDAIGVDGPVLAVSPALHAESCLVGDADLLDESGVPRLRWYLTNTLLADVLQRRARTGLDAVIALLDEAADSIHQEATAAGSLAHLDHVEHQFAEKQRRLDRLTSGLQSQVQHQIGLFGNDVGASLDRRLSDLNDAARLIIEQGDPGRSWPAIQARIYEAGSDLVVAHLAYLEHRVAEVISALADYLAVEAAALRLDRQPDLRGDTTVAGQRPDVGDIRRTGTSRMSGYDVVRGSLGGLLTTTGTIGTLSTLGQALSLFTISAVGLTLVSVPVGVLGTAWTVKSLMNRRRESDLDVVRRAAMEEVGRYTRTLGQQLRDDSRRVQWSLRTWLTETLNAQVPVMRAELAEEVERLANLRKASASTRAQVAAGRETALNDLSEHLVQARNLLYTLARPEMEPVRR